MVTGVVASHPLLAAETGIILLSSRDCVLADRMRMAAEFQSPSHVLAAFSGIRSHSQHHDDDRTESDALPHRHIDLETVAMNLQLTEHRQRIWDLIDAHSLRLPPLAEQSDQDREWRLALRRMDIRKYEIDDAQSTPVSGGDLPEAADGSASTGRVQVPLRMSPPEQDINRPSSRPTCGKFIKAKDRTSTRIPPSFSAGHFLPRACARLLSQAVLRLNSQGGDPVVELQTNFGGGKTHSMLALYHLFSGIAAGELPGAEELLKDAGIALPKNVRRAVFVGTQISPGKPHKKPDGTTIRTVWGEIAWQLGGKEAYKLVKEDDERATNPGDTMKEIFNKYGPCLILIDEWVGALTGLACAHNFHTEERRSLETG